MVSSATPPVVTRHLSSRHLSGGAVAFTVLSWASVFPLIQVALRDLEPLPLAAARFAVAAALVLAWLAWKRPRRPSLADGARFVLCGLLGIALVGGLLNAGQQSVSASAASFIINAVPILTAVLATLFLGERIGAWGWTGAAISFIGIGVIAAGQPEGLTFGAGATLVLGAAACQAAYFTLQRPLVPRYGALGCTAYTMIAGALLLSPWLPQAVERMASGVAPATIGAVVLLGVFPAALGYAAWAYSLNALGAARCSNFLYLVPPTATGLAFLLTGETPAVSTLIGGAIAIAGVVLVNTRGRPREANPALRSKRSVLAPMAPYPGKSAAIRLG